MEARELKDKAAQFFTKGRFAKAAETYEEFCALDKKDHQARLRCGDAWAKAGKKDKAITSYSLAAEGFAKDGFLPRAIAASKLVLEIDPTHKGVQKMLAELYAQKTGGPGSPRPGAAPARAPAPATPAPEMEISRNVSAPVSTFNNNRKAIDLETAPVKPAVPARPKPEAPSPMNRADALELPDYEIPMDDGGVSVGGMSATKGPNPHRREDAIEIASETKAPEGPKALVETSIEIELTGAQPVTGEVEIPIEGQPLPDVEQLPPELQMAAPLAPAAPPSFELAVDVAPPPPSAPTSGVYELTDEAPAAAASTSGVYDLTEPAPEAPRPSAPVYELTETAPEPPRPSAPVYELDVEAPVPSAPVFELTDVDAPAPVPLPAPEILSAPIVPKPAVAPQLTVDLTPADAGSLSPAGESVRTASSLDAGVSSDLSDAAGPALEPASSPQPSAPDVVAGDAPPVRKAAAPAGGDSPSSPPGIKPAAPPAAVGDAASAPPVIKPASLPPAAGDASVPPGIKPVALPAAASDASVPPRIKPAALPPAVGDAASAPPGIKPVAPAEVAPPGLKPKKGDAPPVGSSPSSSRIWLPPTFTPATPRDGASASASTGPSSTPAPPSEPSTDLERSLQTFMSFDPDAPAAPAPKVTEAPAPRASFTELDLDEGDSLLHAVDAAARTAQASPAASLEEEAMEAPEEARPEAGGLPKIPLFSDLPEDAFIALFEKCPLQRFDVGQLVFEQGDKGDAFYVLCGGSVRVFRTDNGVRRDLATLEEGSFFGEMALLSEAPRSASVEAAAEDTQVLVISAEILTELSTAHPVVATALKKFCRQRMLSNLMNTAPLFAPFNRNDRRDLVQKFRARDVKRGDVLVKEGATSDGLYVVLSGEVDVEMKGARIASLKEGQVFGEMSLLLRSPASATVRAARHTSLLRLPKQDFDMLILSHPQVLEHVSTLIDERRKSDVAREKTEPSGML